MALKNTYIIEKSNELNEIRSTKMSLQELRFFSIYLAKINARDISTRRVCFPLSDFQKIMEFGRLNIKQLQESTNKLLCKVVNIPNADGGYTGFTIFKRVRVFKDDSEKWCIEIDASDDALPLLFNLKKNYFTYELWNALRLKSVNQLRMYELLKQHERLDRFEITVSELREYLFISPDQYSALKDFRIYVINSCQKALAKNTDICFTYERGKLGNRGKWLTIIFHISKNEKYADPLELQDFIDNQSASQSDCPSDERPQPTQTGTNGQVDYEQSELADNFSNEYIAFLASACNYEFTEVQMNEIFVIISNMDFIEYEYKDNNLTLRDNIRFSRLYYLREVYARLNVYAETHEVRNRYALFKSFILNDRDKFKQGA